MRNRKGIVETALVGYYIFAGFIAAGAIGYPFYKAGLIGEGGKYAQVGKVQFKDVNGNVTTDRAKAWFNQDKP